MSSYKPFPSPFTHRGIRFLVVYGLHHRGRSVVDGGGGIARFAQTKDETRERYLLISHAVQPSTTRITWVLLLSRFVCISLPALLCFLPVASIEACSANGTNEEYSSMERVFNLVAVAVARQRHANF